MIFSVLNPFFSLFEKIFKNFKVKYSMVRLPQYKTQHDRVCKLNHHKNKKK